MLANKSREHRIEQLVNRIISYKIVVATLFGDDGAVCVAIRGCDLRNDRRFVILSATRFGPLHGSGDTQGDHPGRNNQARHHHSKESPQEHQTSALYQLPPRPTKPPGVENEGWKTLWYRSRNSRR